MHRAGGGRSFSWKVEGGVGFFSSKAGGAQVLGGVPPGGRNCAIVIAESIARVIAAIRITSVR